MKNFTYYIPTKVLFGFGALKNLHKENLPGNKALIVTTSGGSVKKHGFLDALINELNLAKCNYEIFHEVKPNPSLQNVMDGAKKAKENSCDFILGLGGGSAMDASKAIAIMAVNPGDYWDYQVVGTGKGKVIENNPLPIVCITTTAGTGSEVDPWTVTTNEETKEKLGFGYDKTYPTISVVDPDLMMTVPPRFTAFQGFDAFFHAAESVIHKGEHAMGEMFALKAVEYVNEYLPKAVKDGSDKEARYYMALANSFAGYFMMTTSEHTFEHSLSALKPEVAHGAGLIALSSAYHSFFISKEAAREGYIKLARAMGMNETNDPNDFIKALELLKSNCKVDDVNLTSFGFNEENLDELTKLTYELGRNKFKNDPYPLSDVDIKNIFKESL